MRGERMPAKIITLSQKDQDLLRVALTKASEEWGSDQLDTETRTRIKELKERLV